MPPRRKGPSTRAQIVSAATQSTLSFAGSKSKVVKASTSTPAGKKQKVTQVDDDHVVAIATDGGLVGDNDEKDGEQQVGTPESVVEKVGGEIKDTKPTTETATESALVEMVVRSQARKEEKEVEKPRDKYEEEAQGVSQTQLKKYWKERELERRAPRVHQEGLSMNEKILRHFDLSSQYGPSIGISRLNRWKRAQELNLHPPIEILAVLLMEDEKENVKAQRAYVDELMSGRFVDN